MHLTSDQKQEISKELQRHSQIFGAYLFGSQAKGITGPLSDIDIGLIMDPKLAGAKRQTLLTSIFQDLNHLLKTDFIDLIDLERAPVLLRYRAMTEGIPFFANDQRFVNDFLIHTVKLFEDFRPHLETQKHLVLKKIASYVTD